MRNRAKCKLCGDVIESFHQHDYVECSCKEIAVDGGNYYFKCAAKNWNNFLRVDDDNNEFSVKVQETIDAEVQENPITEHVIPTKKDLLSILDDTIKMEENLPDHEKWKNLNRYDLITIYYWLRSYLRAPD